MTTCYLVNLVDRVSGKAQQIIINSECSHGIQEFVDKLVAEHDPGIVLEHPSIDPGIGGKIEVIPAAVAAHLMARATA